MSCIVPANQPIYQALLEKANSYPEDKVYQKKAYENAAQNLLTCENNLYSLDFPIDFYNWLIPGAGQSITNFIKDFIKTEVFPSTTSSTLTYSTQAMDEARRLAAQNAPKVEVPQPEVGPENKPVATNPLQDIIDEVRAIRDEVVDNVPVYTSQNPRRSKRNIGKPSPIYYTQDDDYDEIYEGIKYVCDKKGLTFSEDLVDEYRAWLPTAPKSATEEYFRGSYVHCSTYKIAKEWASLYSTTLQEQIRINKALPYIQKWCRKNDIEYDPIMPTKFSKWYKNPANKVYICNTYTHTNCIWPCCDPIALNPTKKVIIKYFSPAQVVNSWFSTLKKVVVF